MSGDPFAFSRQRAAHGAPSAPPSGTQGWQQPSPPTTDNDGWHHAGSPPVANDFASIPPAVNAFPPQAPQYPPLQPNYASQMPATQGWPATTPAQAPSMYPQMPGFPSTTAAFGAPGMTPGPDVLAQVASNPMAQMGMVYAQQAMQQGMSRYMPGASLLWQTLRYYFDVSNQYVVRKLTKVLFPFRSKRWQRMTAVESGQTNRHGAADGSGTITVYAAPMHDENAPDLYIPLMAFITYVLAYGLVKGTTGRFHPELLVQTSSNCLVTAILEVAIVRAGLYSLAVEGTSLVDLVAYSGYKYVGLCINIMIYLLLGSSAYSLALLYTGLAAVYFSINTLMPVVRPQDYGLTAGAAGEAQGALGTVPSRASNTQKNYLVVLVGVLQILLMWWLGPSISAGVVKAAATAASG